jgi:hypothetical protein
VAAAACSGWARHALRAGLAAFLLAGCAAGGLGAGFTATGPTIRDGSSGYVVETTPGKDAQGRAMVSGYVYGRGGRPRVLLESLDANGSPIAQQLVYVDQDMSAGHAYFEVRPNTPGVSYRGRVQSVQSLFNGAP